MRFELNSRVISEGQQLWSDTVSFPELSEWSLGMKLAGYALEMCA